MTTPSGQHTYREIKSQGDTWAATLAAVAAQADNLRPWLIQRSDAAVFTGCGSTYYLSLAAAAIWQTLTGKPARGLPASELWLFPEAALAAPAPLLVAVSRSAETTETLHAVDMYRKHGGQDVLCVTCYADRPLAAQATHTVVARDAEEESVAQTRSFTSMLLLTQYLAALAAEKTDVIEQLQRLPDAARRIMSDYEQVARQFGERPDVQRFTFLGSGPYYGLACEAMLKMKEMSLSASEAFHFLEFRHGPKSTVGPDMLVVGLISEAARAHEVAVLAEMQQLGAQLLVIAESGDGLPTGNVVELRSGLDDIARAPLTLPILQLMAYYKALSSGLDPDRPTNLESVVRLDR